jgi:uncharacterized protein YbjT (DUF2867 family)
MIHLVLGGTGTVGSAVVRGLLEKGETVRVLTRSAEKAKSLPAGATAVVGDLNDPTTYPQVFTRDIEGLFLLNAVSATELQEGLCALNEARQAGVKRLVYLSVHDVTKGPHIPHFASKIAMEGAIRGSGVPYTILQPNNFFQNDVWFLDVITKHGIYPQPIGPTGISRVDVRDIAAAAVRALTGSEHVNKTYALVGPQAWTGEATAAEWGQAIGREVRYAGDDLVLWAEQQRQYLPAWMVYDFGLMYAMFQKEGLKATGAQLEETNTIVGAPPRRYQDYVAETAATLSGTGSAT